MKTLVLTGSSSEKEADDIFLRIRHGEAQDFASESRRDAIEKIRNGEIETPPIVAPLQKALTAEKTARDNLSKAERARIEADGVQRKWEAFVLDFERLENRVRTAEERIQHAHTRIDGVEQFVVEQISNPNDDRDVLDAAMQVESARLAIPLMERGLKKVRNELRSHIAAMRDWGAKNGVPKNILDSLPNE